MSTHAVTLQWPYYKCITCKKEAPADAVYFNKDGTAHSSSPPGEPWKVAHVRSDGPEYRVALCPECAENFKA